MVFLGTGTSSGVPAIACDCRVCTSPDPRDARLRAGVAVLWNDPRGQPRTVLIDATPDLRQQALRAGLRRCDAILFTHNHVDHTFGLDEVRRFNAVQGGPIEVMAEDHTLEHLYRVYKHIFDKAYNVNDAFVATLVPRRIAPGDAVELFGMRFTPVRLLHGRLPIVGFRIEAAHPALAPRHSAASAFPLAYCTDVSGVPPETWPALKGLRTLVIDALRFKAHPTHLTIEQALGVAERVGAAGTYFTHMSHDVMHAEVEATLPEGVRLAYDGLVVE